MYSFYTGLVTYYYVQGFQVLMYDDWVPGMHILYTICYTPGNGHPVFITHLQLKQLLSSCMIRVYTSTCMHACELPL